MLLDSNRGITPDIVVDYIKPAIFKIPIEEYSLMNALRTDNIRPFVSQWNELKGCHNTWDLRYREFLFTVHMDKVHDARKLPKVLNHDSFHCFPG